MAKPYERKPWSPPQYPTPHADIICSDCKQAGCWIPVKHAGRRNGMTPTGD